MNARSLASKNSQIRKGSLRPALGSRVLAPFLLILVAAAIVYAGVTASISGTVTDSAAQQLRAPK